MARGRSINTNSARTSAAMLALLLLVPVPTIGTMIGLAEDGTVWHRVGYFAAKAWILLLPLCWHIIVDRRRPRFPKWRWDGIGVGAGLGLAIGALIVGAYFMLGPHLIDVELVRARAAATGLDRIEVFIVFFIYLCLINALLEEYVWRWFVFRKCEDIIGRGKSAGLLAVGLAALLFTVHHTVALGMQTGVMMTLLGSLGVFIGGAAWSWCYLRFRSIWSPYVSHIIVDLSIAVVAWMIIFG